MIDPQINVLVNLASRFNYKPNVKIQARADEIGIHLLILMLVPDSSTPDGPSVKIGHASHLSREESLRMTPDRFKLWVRSRVLAAETHEMDEFLTFDGKQLHNPHEGENGR